MSEALLVNDPAVGTGPKDIDESGGKGIPEAPDVIERSILGLTIINECVGLFILFIILIVLLI